MSYTMATPQFERPGRLRLPSELLAKETHRYVCQFRRVEITPSVYLIFENEATLWFRIQELSHVVRLSGIGSGANAVNDQLAWYRRFLARGRVLRAALNLGIHGRRATRDGKLLRQELIAGSIALESQQGYRIVGELSYSPSADPFVGWSLWVEFPFSASDVRTFRTEQQGWRIVLHTTEQVYLSEPLADRVWHSLLEDLA